MTGFDYGDWFDDILRAADGSATYASETGQEFEAWQESFHAELRDVLGFPAVCDSAVEDIDPRRREHPEATIRHRGHERQTWSVRTERGFRVLFYLLPPNSVNPPYSVAIALCGHTGHGKDLAAGVAESEVTGRHIADDRRDMARQTVQRGFVIVAPDMCAFGELSPDTSNDSDSSGAVSACTCWQKRAQLPGQSLVGECVRNVRRLVDLVGRHSALDDRVGHVATCASVCPLEDSIVPIDRCPCSCVPGLRRLDETQDIVGLVTSRPLHVVTDESDPIPPVVETRRVFGRIQGRYCATDAKRECSPFVGDGDHRFFEASAWPFLRNRL